MNATQEHVFLLNMAQVLEEIGLLRVLIVCIRTGGMYCKHVFVYYVTQTVNH